MRLYDVKFEVFSIWFLFSRWFYVLHWYWYHTSLVNECSTLKRKIISILDQVFPEYSDLFSDTFGVTSKELLSKYPLPEDMLELSTEELINLLTKASKSRLGNEKAQEIKEFAKNSFGISFAKQTFSF